MIITKEKINEFINTLQYEEYCKKTILKYRTDIKKLANFMKQSKICKEDMIDFKEYLCKKYKPRSVNSILAACNLFFTHQNRLDLKVKQLKIQHTAFCDEERELSKREYEKLLRTVKQCEDHTMLLIIQTLGNTGIRISELPFITIEAITSGKAEIRMKGKNRTILIPKGLKQKLQYYATKHEIKKGPVFVTKNAVPYDRSNIWRKMKYYAEIADINPNKVFPHNLRHLFARQFYRIKKDIAQLADILGHSNINTTRIYMISTGEEHQRILEKMQLLL